MRDKHLYHGRVHTSYAQLRNDEHGPISGRLSSYEPNLQNLTSVDRHPEQGKLLRSIFVPDAGYRLYEVDYSQCEVRLAAHVGKIASWIQGYNADPPLDAHSVVAQITGLPRVNAKTVNLAILLGAGKDKAIDMLGVPYEQGEAILEQYHERFPEIRALRKAVSEKFVRRGYLRSVLGRRYRLKDSSQGYTGLSRILQGGNADVTKLALTLVDQIPEVTLLNTVHDSLVFQTQDEKAIDRVVEAMTDYINDRFRLRAPLTVDVKSGPNWGAME
jgi:DNA polymerase-1